MPWSSSRRFGSGLEKLSAESFARAAFYIDLLAAEGPLLGDPYTRQLDGKLRELRFYLDDLTMRISYWIAPQRRVILLTVFRKTRMREDREVDRARRALYRCRDEAHSVDEEW
ncbi:type II toxin-antitoxin system RelE/ParE family toxin [Nonomuraea sp. NPDC003214]